MTLDVPFNFGDEVIIDGHPSIVGRVVGYTWRSHAVQVEISWVSDGTLKTEWVANWRLTPAPRKAKP